MVTMLASYSEVPNARRCKLLERHKVYCMNACDVLRGGGMSSGYRYPVGRAVYGYRIPCIPGTPVYTVYTVCCSTVVSVHSAQ